MELVAGQMLGELEPQCQQTSRTVEQVAVEAAETREGRQVQEEPAGCMVVVVGAVAVARRLAQVATARRVS